MKIALFYFSGTGNTEIIAELYLNYFRDRSIETDLFKIDEILKTNDFPDFTYYDLLGFGFPVHAFEAPKIFYRFIKRIPYTYKRKGFLFKTSGDPFWNGGNTARIKRKLKNKGIDIFHENLCVMPANIFIKFSPELCSELYQLNKKKIEKDTNDIIFGKIKLQKNPLFVRLISEISHHMESFGAKFVGRLIKVNNDCTFCQKCVRNCPTGNIGLIEGKIKFDNYCILCMKCVYMCPENALRMSILKIFQFKDGYDIKSMLNIETDNTQFLSKDTEGMFKRYYEYYKDIIEK